MRNDRINVIKNVIKNIEITNLVPRVSFLRVCTSTVGERNSGNEVVKVQTVLYKQLDFVETSKLFVNSRFQGTFAKPIRTTNEFI